MSEIEVQVVDRQVMPVRHASPWRATSNISIGAASVFIAFAALLSFLPERRETPDVSLRGTMGSAEDVEPHRAAESLPSPGLPAQTKHV